MAATLRGAIRSWLSTPNRLRLSQLLVDRVDRRLHAFRNFLHVHIRRGRRPGVPKQSLYVLDRAFFLSQRSDGPPDDLKRQFRQFQLGGQPMQYPLAVVVRIQKASILVGKDEGIGRRIGTLRPPLFYVGCKPPRNVDRRKTL